MVIRRLKAEVRALKDEIAFLKGEAGSDEGELDEEEMGRSSGYCAQLDSSHRGRQEPRGSPARRVLVQSYPRVLPAAS